MTDIVDPGSINNGDTPDWDAVQAYFDAIYSVVNSPGQLDNNNIKSGAAIAYSKLNLANSIVAGDLASNAVTVPKIARDGSLTSATCSGVNISSLSTWTALASITTSGTGVYIVGASGGLVNTYDSTSFTSSYLIRLYNTTAGAQMGGVVPLGDNVVASSGTHSYPFAITAIGALTTGHTIELQAYSSADTHATCPSNRGTLQAYRVAA